MKRKRELIAVVPVNTRDRSVQVQLWIDVNRLCRELGLKAMRNANGRSRLAGGSVEVIIHQVIR